MKKFFGKTITELRKMKVQELKELLKNNDNKKYQMFGLTVHDKGTLIMLITDKKYSA